MMRVCQGQRRLLRESLKESLSVPLLTRDFLNFFTLAFRALKLKLSLKVTQPLKIAELALSLCHLFVFVMSVSCVWCFLLYIMYVCIVRTLLFCCMYAYARVYSLHSWRLRMGVGHFERKFRREGALPTNHCWCQSSRVIALSYGIKISAVHHLDLSQCTRVTDRRTDRQTDRLTTPKTTVVYTRALKMLKCKTFQECITVFGLNSVRLQKSHSPKTWTFYQI